MIMRGGVLDDANGALVGEPGQDDGKSLYVTTGDVDGSHD
jgi:hypothetical protein